MNITRRGLMISLGAVSAMAAPAVSLASQVLPMVEPVQGTALENVAIRRTVSMIQGHIHALLQNHLFDYNDDVTRQMITSEISTYLQQHMGRRVLYDFVVVCDQTNNTRERIDNNELWVDVAIQPRTKEFIYIPFRLRGESVV